MKATACNAVYADQRFEGLIFVSTIRSHNPFGFGGCIFSGSQVDQEGIKLGSGKVYVVIAKSFLLPGEVSKGERWLVSGRIIGCELKNFNGYRITEVTIEADVPLVKERETGDLIIYLVAKNPKFKRLGEVRMRKLWNKYGNAIYEILDCGDLKTLSNDLGVDGAAGFIEAWHEHVSGATITFLSAHGIPLWLSRKVISYHGANVKAALEEDPYRLLSFTASWLTVDALARSHFHIPADDPRRLRAAIEEGLYRLMDKKGHTCVPSHLLKPHLRRLLGNRSQDESILQIEDVLADNAGNGAYIVTDDQHYWPTGAYIMEEYLAQKIATMVATTDAFSQSLFVSRISESEVNHFIWEFEQEERVRQNKPFLLNNGQRIAVHKCVSNQFSLITGGAGTGKTTVLRCLYYVLSKVQYSICQMALSGRAAKRMHTATGISATTIAGYLRNSNDIQSKLGKFAYYVIDEASMLDMSTTYQIFRSLPQDRNIRMVMVGDPYQLPPIMAGLVLHILVQDDRIPATHLTESKRQEEITGIPAVANSIRNGFLPMRLPDSTGVRFISCPDEEILSKTLELFCENSSDTQILCATKSCSRSGTKAINAACSEKFSKENPELMVRSDAIQGASGYSGLREKDRVMFTRNDYVRGVTNGLIGFIAEIYDEPRKIELYEEPAIAKGEFEGVEIEIFESDVVGEGATLELGYAVTVHKAQGSQWPRVLVPIRQSKNLDRTLLYTAITRAENEVVVVGDINVLRTAVERMPIPHMRIVGLGRTLRQKLDMLSSGVCLS